MEIIAADVFTGTGAFSIAAEDERFRVVSHCDNASFPKAVCQYYWPYIPFFDDICDINKGSFYEATGYKKIHILIGGSPCQGFSVAGTQLGFDDNRSCLFLEQMRVARELQSPYILWENVAGAFSSNNGRDFASIICEFTGWTENELQNFQTGKYDSEGNPKYKWGEAGVFQARSDNDYSIVYRILDTQYFGLPQQRRRIFLVGRLGRECRPEILFNAESVLGHPAPRQKPRQKTASFTSGGFGSYNPTEHSGTLRASNGCRGMRENLVAAYANGGIGNYNKSSVAATLRLGGDIKGGGGTLVARTLDANYGRVYGCDNQHIDQGCPNFVLFENNASDARQKEKNVAPTLQARMGTGGNQTPYVCVHASQDPIVSEDKTHALGANSTQAVCVSEHPIGRDSPRGNGIGAKEDISYTLNTAGVHAIAANMRIRRLTPLECERLQGMPDNFTKIPYRGKPAELCPDGPRYESQGNGVSVNPAKWVLKNIKRSILKDFANGLWQ